MQLDPSRQQSLESLNNRTILVTGANKGIGRELSIYLAQQGAEVLLLGRDEEGLNLVYDEIVGQGLLEPAAIVFDLERAAIPDYAELSHSLADSFDCIDGVVHNAALLGDRTSIEQYTPETWLRLMQVNANAPFLLTRSLMPLLEASENGRIVFVSSSVGRKGRANWGAYAASKAVLENLNETLADELDGVSDVKCNSLNPGATRTTMRAQAFPGENPASVKPCAALMPLFHHLLSPQCLTNGERYEP